MAELQPQIHRLHTDDGHRFELLDVAPSRARATVLWLPAMGVSARHYLPLAQALAAHGIATFVHEWRGLGSSSVRAGRDRDWGYRALLQQDIAASHALAARAASGELILGGHSLGGQLSACYLGLHPQAAQRLWLVASGSPHPSGFPRTLWPMLWWAYRAMPATAALLGHFPGRQLRFAGNEARGVIADWARTARTGHYRVPQIDVDIEAGMRNVRGQALGIALQHDWLAPPASLANLFGKLPAMQHRAIALDDATLGARADHFGWMRTPQAVADLLAASLG